MTLMQLTALFLALITAVGWLNARMLRLPTSVAMLGAGGLSALMLIAAQTLIEPFWGFNDVRSIVGQLDFRRAVLDYLLAFLIFASGLQVDLRELRRRRLAVWTLASLGVLISTGLIGAGLWAVSGLFGVALPLAWALTFGALISPTDPIAVGEPLRAGALSVRLGSVLQGEALFNDGVGFVVFSTMLTFGVTGAAPHPLQTAGAILLKAGGGLVLGGLCARLVGLALRSVEDPILETTATIALAVGVYVTADVLHVSGPIAAAAAGLTVGQDGLRRRMSDETRRSVEGFWELADQILNALLFLLLGLQVFILPFSVEAAGLWAAAVVLTLAARLAVVLPWGALFRFRNEERGASLVLTWGGLRGGVSLALALSLPHGPWRDLLLSTTFVVVAFSILVQGLTFPRLARRFNPDQKADRAPSPGPAEP